MLPSCTLCQPTSHQYYSLILNQHQSPANNQSAVLFSHNKSATTNSHQPQPSAKRHNEIIRINQFISCLQIVTIVKLQVQRITKASPHSSSKQCSSKSMLRVSRKRQWYYSKQGTETAEKQDHQCSWLVDPIVTSPDTEYPRTAPSLTFDQGSQGNIEAPMPG